MAQRELVVDACCVINVLAMGREVEIVRALGARLLDTSYTCGEPCVLWNRPDEDGRCGRMPVTTKALRDAGLLVTQLIDTDAMIDAFVAAAAQIRDADASCIAVAGVLELPLVTDDRKEKRIARELFPSIEIVSTLDLLYDAQEVLAWDEERLIAVAADLRWRGRFAPPRQDARSPWYADLLRRAGLDGS